MATGFIAIQYIYMYIYIYRVTDLCAAMLRSASPRDNWVIPRHMRRMRNAGELIKRRKARGHRSKFHLAKLTGCRRMLRSSPEIGEKPVNWR